MATALLAIRLAPIRTRAAITGDGCFAGGSNVHAARSQIFADDGTHERAGTHCAELEQTHLLARESHLRNGVINDNAQLGMREDLECVSGHGGRPAINRQDEFQNLVILLQRRGNGNRG